MFKKAIGIILLLLLILPRNVFATEIEDYQSSYGKYREDFKQFTVSKNEYLKQQTLASQDNTISKLKQVLIDRADTLRLYFTALKAKTMNSGGLNAEEKSALVDKLDRQIVWLKSYISKLKNLEFPTLDQLLNLSKEFEQKQGEFRLLSSEILSNILKAKLTRFDQDYLAIYGLVEKKVSQSSTPFLNNWLNQAKDMRTQAAGDLDLTDRLIKDYETIRTNESVINEKYGLIKDQLEESKANYIKGVGFLIEIVSELNKN